MHKKLEIAQDKFIEGVARIGNILGINSFNAKLYAFLYLNNKPKSLDEITDALGVSKGNVSVNIRQLEKWGAVRNVWVKGSRKDFYQVNPDIKNVFLDNVKDAIRKRVDELSVLIEEFKQILETMDADTNEEDIVIIATYRDRLKKIVELKTMTSNLLSLAENFLK